MRAAVLALQGDFTAHRRALEERGLDVIEARSSAELDAVDALVLPGGESTTMLRLLAGDGLESSLREVLSSGIPVLATCAGLILLAREVRTPVQPSLGVLDVTVARNGYGRQRESTICPVGVIEPAVLGTTAFEGVFIRAPRILAVGASVETLAVRDKDPVLVRQGSTLAATFHPELSRPSPVLDLFVRMVRER